MVLGANIWSPPSEEAAEDYRRFTGEYPREKVLSLYSSQSEDGILDSSDRSDFIASAILKAIEDHNGFSLVRMSDGEGNCLFKYEGYAALQDYILKRISYMHFGESSVVSDAREAFRRYMTTAVQSADVVCVPEEGAQIRGFQTPDENLDVRAVVGNRVAAVEVAELLQQGQITASAWTNRHLLSHYEKIFGNRESVGVISSYPELGDLMRDKFGIKRVVQHIIPRQAVFLKTSDRKNSFHYPDEFDNIVANINPEPGMPYLVSGGLLAKHYCQIVKSRGGVAIDTGSVPEIWLGIPNRGLSESFIDQWKLV